MGRRSKFTEQQKLAAVMEVLDGKCSQTEAARRIGASKTAVKHWLAVYSSCGADALQEHVANRHYSLSTKLKVVRAYLSGEGSQQELRLKEAELERARVENMFLKKVEEIERRWEADARAGRAWRRHSRRSQS